MGILKIIGVLVVDVGTTVHWAHFCLIASVSTSELEDPLNANPVGALERCQIHRRIEIKIS